MRLSRVVINNFRRIEDLSHRPEQLRQELGHPLLGAAALQSADGAWGFPQRCRGEFVRRGRTERGTSKTSPCNGQLNLE